MSKQKSMLFVLLLVIVMLAGCALPAAETAPAAHSENAPVESAGAAPSSTSVRGTLRFPHELIFNGSESLDPASPTQFTAAMVLLYNRLARLDQAGVPQPELATAWQANEDATEWTFSLRDDVTFHDGKPFTSADVAYTIAHILDPATESPQASLLDLIASVETPDDQTVVFQLSQGHADFPLLLTHRATAIIPENSAETIGATGIGTGPFILETLAPDGTTTFVANDAYWKGEPLLAGIELISLPDAEARTLAEQAGQIDILFDATPTQTDLFVNDDSYTILRFPSGSWTTLVMRTDTPPFDDIRVRKAMQMAANRAEMIALVMNGEATVSCDTPVAPNDAYRWNGECPQDIEGAKALLAEAGYPDGIDVTLYTTSSSAQLIPLAEVYQQQAAAAGINVSLEIAPADSFWSDVWMVEPFVVSYWRERTADQILNEVWRSTAKWNEAYYKNPAYDQLLDEARTELDFEARRELYQAAQQLIAEEGGHLIPYHVNQFHIVNNQVSGVTAQALTEIEWHTISKSE
ncbi:MAG: ABC transporter substrate-binding protein [Caldilineaceae bacterium]|nr:ABC transporter substrate-binding protein [Caldilineaceae bacterium]